MQVQLRKPELERFIDDQVRAGRYTSPEDAVEAAIAQMMVDQTTIHLTDEDMVAIHESEAQIDRGESVEFDTFASEMRKKHSAI